MKIIKVLSVVLAILLITGCVSTRVETDNSVNLSEKENIIEIDGEKENIIESDTENIEDYSSKIQGHWFCEDESGIMVMSIEDNDFTTAYYCTDSIGKGTIENISDNDNGTISVTVNFPESYIMDEYTPQSTVVLTFSTNDDYNNTLVHHSDDGTSYTYTYAGETYEQLMDECNKLMF